MLSMRPCAVASSLDVSSSHAPMPLTFCCAVFSASSSPSAALTGRWSMPQSRRQPSLPVEHIVRPVPAKSQHVTT